jgi:hypothetical protein
MNKNEVVKIDEKAKLKKLAGQAKDKAEAEAKEQAAKDAREKDKEHRKKINNAALQAIVKASGIKESEAQEIVTAIAQGKIENVQINY